MSSGFLNRGCDMSHTYLPNPSQIKGQKGISDNVTRSKYCNFTLRSLWSEIFHSRIILRIDFAAAVIDLCLLVKNFGCNSEVLYRVASFGLNQINS